MPRAEGRILARAPQTSILVSAQRAADGGSLLSLILRQLEAIKFASDWKIIGQQRGGKKYKGAFARSVYEARTGQPLPEPSHCSKEALAAFKTFKTRQQTLVATSCWTCTMNLALQCY
ncbi:hypothetical protein PILCRDRAFT_734393 [Piloderma croceum F 1598]|uniref:Uncharacterized protein n=1 Tax=Piloderma croceum (strain F 1598) TaxID=765440 RepID=A0A0C3EYL9_PILCF|nr:hypothetical protein PILCRDRAFT_734393 [Piloderma croceum F 1598]